MEISLHWLIIGFLGQLFFSARFILQWIYSEINKKSIIPLGFWFFSILGGLTLLLYAIHRKDPVFIMGQATGLFIYARNLYFINKQNSRERVAYFCIILTPYQLKLQSRVQAQSHY